MLKRAILTFVVFCLVGGLVFVAAALAKPDEVSLPTAITPETLCPVATCSQPDGSCHAAEPSPVPDGSFTMACPEVRTCFDSACHAWDRLMTYSKPKDFSLNLWIMAPIVITVGFVLLVRKLR